MDLTKVDRDLSKLYPPFKVEIEKVIAACHVKKLNVYTFEGFRSFERQHFLYEQGRRREGKIVTNADQGLSAHNYGLAVDLVFDGDPVKAGYQWTWNGNYTAVGEIVRLHKKLEWAGDWKSFREYPHVQWDLPCSIVHLKAKYDEFKQSLPKLWDWLSKQKS